MSRPRLVIRKGMIDVNGKPKPAISVQAFLDPAVQEKLLEQFSTEILFKRAVYAQGFPAGTPVPSPAMAPALNAFLRNDACPEISVKSLLAGQMVQSNSIWDVVAFEFVAERAYDSLCELARAVAEFGREKCYFGRSPADLRAFEADAEAEARVAAA